MRPVNRGPWPLDENGNRKIFSDYHKARGDLLERLGNYCSYCERHRDEAPDVEHVLPKDPNPTLITEWENMLLACRNCNSTKSCRDIRIEDYFWPHIHNTFLAFDYLEGGRIRPSEGLSEELREKAVRTLRLTGLEREPKDDPERKDLRWKRRGGVWDVAGHWRNRIEENDTPVMRELAVLYAKDRGYWSIWMTVFRDDDDMLRRLIEAFPGTRAECFDASDHYRPVPVDPRNL